MDCFKVLGIEATEDKELIKKAYRKLLPTVHPEEDPEGFQRLRQAYEEALNYEKTDGEEDGSELGLWMAKVRALYEDFEKRLSIDEWEKLLEEDVCFAIDTAQEADKRLLDYLMDNYYIPHEVFHILEARFDWEERRKELCDAFPAGFIDYLISNAKYEDNFRYYAFKPEPGRDYETFISNYFYLLNNIYNQEDKERESVMEKTCLMGIEHPDFMVLRIRYALVAKEYDKAKEIAEAALKNYENDIRLMYAASQVELVLENFEAAAGFSERILKLEENHVGAKIVAADALYGFKRYEEALESYKKLSKELPYDNYLSDAIYNTYAEIAKICKEKLEKEPENDECRMLYLDAAINSYQYEDAEKEALCISGAKVNDYTYNLNMGKIYNGLEDYEKSLKYYERALELFDAFSSGDKDDHADLIADRGLQWEKMEKYKTALTVYDEGLELYPDFDRLNYRKAAVLNQMERSKEALDLCEKALSIKETSNAYHYKAESLFMLGEYEDALRNCDLAMERIPYYATYKIKLDTFYELRDFQAIIELTEYLRNVRLDTSEVLIIESKALIELERYEDAKKTLTEVQDKEPDNKEAYYEMATVYWYEKEYQKSLAILLKTEGEVKDRRGYLYFLGNLHMRLNKLDEAEEVYTSLFAKAPDAHDYLNCRLGALYKKRGDDAKAIRFYKTAIKINPKHPYANGEIADIYEESGDYAKALEYNTLQLEIEPSDYFYIQRGILYGHMNDAEKELENYMRAYELNPNNSFANSNIGLCHMKEGRVEEAVKYYERAIELDFPYPDAHINIALCLSRLGRNAEAYRYLDSGLEKYPERHWMLLRKGQVYQVNEKRYDEAIEIFRRYAEVSGDRLGAYLEIGDCYHDKDDIRKAILWYEKAAQEDKKSEDPYLRIGGLWYEEGNYRKALHFFKKAFGKNKESAKVFNRIGESYAGLGKKAKAEEYFKKALTLYIKEYEKALENNEVRACEYTHMADLYRKLGQREKAKEFFEKAFAIDAGYKYCYRMVCHEGYYSLGLLYEAEGDVENALNYLEKSQELWPQRETREAVERLKGR